MGNCLTGYVKRSLPVNEYTNLLSNNKINNALLAKSTSTKMNDISDGIICGVCELPHSTLNNLNNTDIKHIKKLKFCPNCRVLLGDLTFYDIPL